jgi:hypothetical protein
LDLEKNNIERQQEFSKRSMQETIKTDKLTIGRLLWEKGDPNVAEDYFKQENLTPEEIEAIKKETTH